MKIKRNIWPLLALFCSGLLHATCVHPTAAKRIISLAPDLTETLFALNAGEQIVGVIQGSDYPDHAKQITQVGSYSGIDLEKIVALQPDLIVVWGNSFARQMNALKKLNYSVYVSNPQNIADIPAILRDLGCLTGHVQEAETKANQFTQQINSLKTQYQNKKPISVFYQIGDYSLITINKTSWINQVITLCGGRNVFANAKFAAPEVTWEAVINANPEVVLSDAKNPVWRQRWETWPNINAVKHHTLYSINPDLLERASPRLALGAKEVCRILDSCRKSMK